MKNTKKYKNLCVLFVLVLIFASVVLSAGCGNKSSNDTIFGYIGENGGGFYDFANSYDAEYAPPQEMKESYADEKGYEIALVAAGSTGGEVSAASNLPANRKIIRDAYITMEVEDIEKSYDNILASLAKFGGYEAGRNMNASSTDYRYAATNTATLKIPAEKLDSFLNELKKEGEIKNSSISSADITDQYFDAQIRLTNLEKMLDKNYELFENATKVDDQLKIFREINEITTEIEQLKGRLRRWNDLVEYSTVTLNLYRPYEAPVPEPEPRVLNWESISLDDMGWLISSGFLNVVSTIFRIIQLIIIAIAVISPIAIPVAIVVIILIRRTQKKKKQIMQMQNNANNK